MPALNTLKILAPLAVVASLAISPAFGATKGTAGKRLTREQAWAFCKAKSTSGSGGIRASRGMPPAVRA